MGKRGKKKAFFIYVRIMENEEVFYGSDGCIFIEDDVFEGYLTEDYLVGAYENESLDIEILVRDVFDKSHSYYNFKTKTRDFELPETYILSNKEDSLFQLELIVQELISDYETLNRKKEFLNQIRILHGIGDYRP